MPDGLSKSVKKNLRELVLEAHEKALRQPLQHLSLHFDRWRQGEIDAIDLADLVREFNDGPSRRIYKRFTWSRNDDLPMLVAAAIHEGLLDPATIPGDTMAAPGKWLQFLRSQ